MVLLELEAAEADETSKIRLAALKKEQVRLTQERHRIEGEMRKHRRELKRVQLEDRSKFKRGEMFKSKHSQYLLMSLLGKGGFSEVWKAYDLGTLREVAVKVHQVSDNWSDEKRLNYTKHAIREYDIHRHLDHQNVVRLHDVFEINDNAFATVCTVAGVAAAWVDFACAARLVHC